MSIIRDVPFTVWLNKGKMKPEFICFYCDKEFQIQDNLVEHLKIHIHGIKCVVCNIFFLTYRDLEIHDNLKHRVDSFKNLMSESENKLLHMTKLKLLKKALFCSTVSVQRNRSIGQKLLNKSGRALKKPNSRKLAIVLPSSENKPDFNFLFQSVNDNNSNRRLFVCEICGIQFRHRGNLNVHYISHRNERKFQCEVCGKRFNFRKGLKSHQQVHAIGKRHSCNKCDKTFSFISNLRRHESTHDGQKRFLCATCGKMFTRRYHAVAHQKSHLVDSDTASANYLKENLKGKKGRRGRPRRNTEEDPSCSDLPLTCKLCYATFKYKHNLKRHFKIHGEKEHVCEVCQKKFGRRDQLQLHLRTHTGIKPFTCNICNKSFTEKGSLQKHIRIHTGERPYVCEFCGLAFIVKPLLTRHLTKHASSSNNI